jgi:hypothetical protein
MDLRPGSRIAGVEQCNAAFRVNDIDAMVLPALTANDLIAVGMASAGRRRNQSVFGQPELSGRGMRVYTGGVRARATDRRQPLGRTAGADQGQGQRVV